jgi:hypothetical protein
MLGHSEPHTRYLIYTLLCLLAGNRAAAQADSTANGFWSRIFLPSIELGYQVPTSSLISPSLRFGTSVEYRFRNNNDFFVRLNYDTYGARYRLETNNATTNSIEGTVQFTDVTVSPGYRFGDNTFRFVFCAMPGLKLYDFPTASINGQQVVVRLDGKRIFTTSALAAVEYYLDEKSALTFSVFQNQVWQQVDFWRDGGSAYGFSVGFITSLL